MQGSLPSNSYALVDDHTGYGYRTYTRYDMYCCSNNTSPSATFTYPDGTVSSSNHWNAYVSRHYGGDTYAGCYKFLYSVYYGYNFYLNSYAGVHMCRISDSDGHYHDVNIGLYGEGFGSKSTIPCAWTL